MALKIRFADKTEVPYLGAVETEEYFNGASRRTLTFDIARDAVGLDALDALCTEANCAKLELINEDEGITNIYEGYVLKLKLAVEPVLVDAEKQTYEDRIKLKLGKRTYIEEQLHALGLL
ncbi:MAG: hypothetical protein IJP01_06475 [Oscillospiraceae bacterium]|nr:hypothetical protein [Oscillospiraceae bacterium]